MRSDISHYHVEHVVQHLQYPLGVWPLTVAAGGIISQAIQSKVSGLRLQAQSLRYPAATTSAVNSKCTYHAQLQRLYMHDRRLFAARQSASCLQPSPPPRFYQPAGSVIPGELAPRFHAIGTARRRSGGRPHGPAHHLEPNRFAHTDQAEAYD